MFIFDILQSIWRRIRPETQGQGAALTRQDRMIKSTFPKAHRVSKTGPSPPKGQEPVLVRGKFWKNTREVRWDLEQKQEQPCDSSVEGLIQQLVKGRRREIRRSAAKELGQLGPGAAVAIPALLKSAVDVDATVRELAWDALNTIDPAWPENAEARRVFPDLLAALKSRSSDVSRAAFRLLRIDH